MAMTLATLRSLTRQLIGDPQGSTYSPEMYQDAINFACKEYAKKTGVTYVEDVVDMDVSNGVCVIPSDYLRINRVICSKSLPFTIYAISITLVEKTIGTSNGELVTIPEDPNRYSVYGSAIGIPSVNATCQVGSGKANIMSSTGEVLRVANVKDVITITPFDDPRITDNKKYFEFNNTNLIAYNEYIDFTVVILADGMVNEIKARYANDNT